MKIGFFDSGLGGLTILKAVIKLLPQYDYEYFGDTANLPYGDKDESEIYELTKKGIEELFAKDCLLIIVACNTASAETLRKLQTEYLPQNYPDRKILGVIIPTIETLLESQSTEALLIGTNRTINSQKYDLELAKHKTDLKLKSIPTPELVPLIESSRHEEAYQKVSALIDKENSIKEKVIVLGCTHYSIISEQLAGEYEGKIKIISQDKIIPQKLADYLINHHEIESRLTKNKFRNIFLSKHSVHYDSLLKEILHGTFIAE